eukprot:scaffold25705_cov90-Isochrysis_galbana.AAC.1
MVMPKNCAKSMKMRGHAFGDTPQLAECSTALLEARTDYTDSEESEKVLEWEEEMEIEEPDEGEEEEAC